MNLLSSLRYLVALNAHQHFGRAAQACHVTQPALSNAIRALETEFGVVIVKRDRSFAGLTPEGQRVLESAQRMLREQVNLQQELHSAAHSPRGTLTIAAVPTAVPMAARFAALLQARHAGIVPVLLSRSSTALEQGLDDLSVDLGLGYGDRGGARGATPGRAADARLQSWPQYTEHYFLLRRAAAQGADSLRVGAPMRWKDAARQPLCLLTPDMHNRTIVDAAFAAAGATVQPAMETNSLLAMVFGVVAGSVCGVLPGALLDTVRGHGALEACPLTGPQVQTPVVFMAHAHARPSRALVAAIAWAQDPDWLRHASAHSTLQAP